MGVSKARKHGKYLGGRPFPVVCPICRVCQKGPPDAYYNSRGICNVDHKRLRHSKGLEEWPDLPVMLREGSFRQIDRNPLLWLRQNMSDTHAQTIPPQLHKLEALRIMHVVACRWYGETVYLDSPKPSSIEDVVWTSFSEATEAATPSPIYDPDRVLKERRAKALNAKRAKAKIDPLRRDAIVNIIRPFLVQCSAQGFELPRPRVFMHPFGWTAVWLSGGSSLVLQGDHQCPPAFIGIQDTESEDDFVEFEYNLERFRLVWDIFQAVRTDNVQTVRTESVDAG